MKSYLAEFLTHKMGCATRNGGQVCSCGLGPALVEFEKLRNIAISVRKMRAAQVDYFRSRLSGDLRTSKQWEKEVDRLLAHLWNDEAVSDGKQGRLL